MENLYYQAAELKMETSHQKQTIIQTIIITITAEAAEIIAASLAKPPRQKDAFVPSATCQPADVSYHQHTLI